ncbi:MAG: hypothetical protein NTX66_04475 [Candidatus Falkowbacteria bacterium]|nr:hypothetical protein [Candidatus Falkowbacteria bacterium]
MVNKNKKLLFSGLTMAVALAVLGGFASTTLAAANNSTNTTPGTYTSAGTPKLKNHTKKPSAAMAAKLAAMKKQQAAITAALEANDYNAWVTAVGANSTIAKKINATNFPQLEQIYQLKKQVKTLMTGLGLNNNMKGWNTNMGNSGLGNN